MNQTIEIQDFLKLRDSIPVIDVRTPDEYNDGHIAGAINIPLFSNEERAIVGTIYKKKTREKAIVAGLEFVGPKMAGFAKEALSIARDKKLLLYCWRGGMRSNSMAWLFRNLGIETSVLEGGYKSYRRFGKEVLAADYNIQILGGKTGSGKTEILFELRELGEQMIDLEGLAHHKGSAFGFIHQEAQSQNEVFENSLIEEFLKIDSSRVVWLEDESRNIGRNYIPDELYDQMKVNHVIFLEMPLSCRVKRLVKEYADTDVSEIYLALDKIQKRLGNDNYKISKELLEKEDFATFTEMMLNYYDKAYLNSLSKRDDSIISRLEVQEDNAKNTAKKLVEFNKSL